MKRIHTNKDALTPAVAAAGAAAGGPLHLQPAPKGARECRPDWGSLSEPLLLLIMAGLDSAALAAAHPVCKSWRSAARLSTRTLAFAGTPPDTEQLKLTFPNLQDLSLERMQLTSQCLACVASLPLSSLALRVCRLDDGGAIAALTGLHRLEQLELCEVLGPSPEELDAAIRGLTNLHRLHVESRTAAAPAPSLRSLAFLPRIRQLSVKQAWHRHSFVGLTNLGSLQDLQALELLGATVTNSIMHRLADLAALTQLRIPEAGLVTDAGFEALSGLTALRELDLSCWRPQHDEPVSNAGAAHMAPLCGLTSLNLAGRGSLTGGGLAFLERFAGLECLDLSGAQLDQGSATFLWRLTRLTCLRVGGTLMAATQFDGLSRLTRLAELHASRTGFDDSCCAMLAELPDLTDINLGNTAVTSAGVRQLCTSHPGRLRRLQLNGCRVSVGTLLRALRCQPRGLCVWDPVRRGYLPRWVNTANSLLMVAPQGQTQRLRLRHAPEDSWPAQLAVVALVGAMLAAQAALLLATTVFLLLLPLTGIFVGGALLLAAGCRRRTVPGALVRAATHGEVALTAVLVGVLCVRVPPPPPAMDPHL